MTFQNLNLIPQLLHSLQVKGYEVPTPIQHKAIPHILEGKDIIGSAQTGTGKTAAFALPILQLLFTAKDKNQRGIKTLILAPTRELAQQISDSFRDYGRGLHLKHTVIYGGVSQRPQTDALRNGTDIVIATPGRLLDLMNQGYVRLDLVKFFVLDEVDRMLDMGFINDIKKIITKIPQKRQTIFFSATMPAEIKKLADTLLHQPVIVQTAPASSAAVTVKQYVYFVDKGNKRELLKNFLAENPKHHLLIFTRTKRGADKLVKSLAADGVKAESIHGDKSQGARQRALAQFKTRKINMLVATDVASRGLDITDISHVINFDLPEEAEVYIHRIGRTGRAGAAGTAISYCAQDERNIFRDIQRLVKNGIEILKTPALAHSEQPKPVHHRPKQHEHSSSHRTEHHSEKSTSQSSSHGNRNERKFVPRKKKWHGRWQGKRSSHPPQH